MVDQLINEFNQHRRRAQADNDRLLLLRTNAEGVGSIQYGDDASHGTSSGDRLEKATIRLTEAQRDIAKRRRPVFDLEVETSDWLHERLDAEQARVMEWYIIDGMSYRDIAYRSGHSVGWVAKVINTAKSKIDL